MKKSRRKPQTLNSWEMEPEEFEILAPRMRAQVEKGRVRRAQAPSGLWLKARMVTRMTRKLRKINWRKDFE